MSERLPIVSAVATCKREWVPEKDLPYKLEQSPPRMCFCSCTCCYGDRGTLIP